MIIFAFWTFFKVSVFLCWIPFSIIFVANKCLYIYSNSYVDQMFSVLFTSKNLLIQDTLQTENFRVLGKKVWIMLKTNIKDIKLFDKKEQIHSIKKIKYLEIQTRYTNLSRGKVIFPGWFISLQGNLSGEGVILYFIP
jgi:hypothetical protein